MKLSPDQSRKIFLEYGSWLTSACDRCGKVLASVRYMLRGQKSEWCSRECRGDAEQKAIRKGGRPRKYETPKECRTAKNRQQRGYRAVSVWKKPPHRVAKTKDLQAQKSPLSHYPFTPPMSARKQPFRERGSVRELIERLEECGVVVEVIEPNLIKHAS
jgi:hypothetical protein